MNVTLQEARQKCVAYTMHRNNTESQRNITKLIMPTAYSYLGALAECVR